MNAEGENIRSIMKAKKANRRTLKKNKKGVKAAKTSTRRNTKKQPKTAHQYSEIGLQDLAILLFGEETVHEVKKKMEVRELWNISSNTTQCNNVIGKMTADTDCWICGLKIDSSDPGMSPECEHVLPVAQAVIYLSLYSSKKKQNTSPERNVRKMEYGWAHTVCNQDKSDICCLINSGTKATVSDNNIKFILKRIYTSNRADSLKIKSELKALYPTLGTFIEARFEPVRKRYEDIVNYLNPSSGENRFKLTILAGLVTAMDYSNIREEAHGLLSPEFLAEKEAQKKALTKLLTNEIQQDILNALGKMNLDTLVDAAKIIDSIEDIFNIQTLHQIKQHNLNELDLDTINTLWEESLDLSFLAKIYPQLYIRLGLMFIDPVTKSYLKPKIEYNSYTSMGLFLVIKYFILVEKNLDRNTKIRGPKKLRYVEKLNKIVEDYKKYMNKEFPGIYDFISEYYSHNNTTYNIENDQKN